MGKYFIFEGQQPISKEAISKIQEESQTTLKGWDETVDQQVQRQLNEDDNLVHAEGRIVVKVDIKGKDSHTFQSGLTIKRERNFNNFNRRETQPVSCIVISGEGIPKNAELLVDHNAFHETNRINDYKNSFETEGSDRVRYFSIPYYEGFCWRIGNGEWNALYPYEFALRVFKPYEGSFVGIDPTQIKDTLYVLSGELRGNIVRTLKGCDYCIVFLDSDGRDNYLIVFRPFGEPKRNMEEEAVAIMNELNDKLKDGKLLVGYEIKDAKPLKELVPND